MHGRSTQDTSSSPKHLMPLDVDVYCTFESMPFLSRVERILFVRTVRLIFKNAENLRVSDNS